MTTEETLTGLREMATYDCGFEEQSDIALAAADVIVTLLVEVTSLRKQLDAVVEDLKDALYDPLTIDCGYCKYRGAETDEHVATTGGCHACENHGGFYDCFEWRGLQVAEALKEGEGK